MNSRNQDKKIENIIIAYYNDLSNIEAYESKIRYYNENKHMINCDIMQQIEDIKKIIIEIKFKNKYLEEIINGLTSEEKKYLQLKYRSKLNVKQIENRLRIKERSYYRLRKRILDYLSLVLIFI